MAKKTPADIVIEAFGGVRSAARELGLSPSSITRWRTQRAGIVPTKHIKKILAISAAKNLGINASDLVIKKLITGLKKQINTLNRELSDANEMLLNH